MAQTDTEGSQWEGFLLAWAYEWADTPKTVAELVEELQRPRSPLREALPDALADILDKGDGAARQRLGQALLQQCDTRHGSSGLRLTRAGEDSRRHVARWKVDGVAGLRGSRGRGGRATPPSASPAGGASPGGSPPHAPPAPEPRQTDARDGGAREAATPPLPAAPPAPVLPPDLADWPEDWRDYFEERAAILEADDELPRAQAEQQADTETRQAYAHWVQTTFPTATPPLPASMASPPAVSALGASPVPVTPASASPAHPRDPSGVDVAALAADLELDLDDLSTRLGRDLHTLSYFDALAWKHRGSSLLAAHLCQTPA